jgi:ketosteroid isomerase-like protein
LPSDPEQQSKRLIVLVTIGLFLSTLSACTTNASTRTPSPSPALAPSQAPASLAPQPTVCGREGRIKAAIARFVHAWNDADVEAIHDLLTRDAQLDMSDKRQGATSAVGNASYLTGWNEIGAFVRNQWRFGQQFSYSSLQLVPTGAYAPDLRSLYADGSHQTYSDAKFGVSCNSGKFEHIVLVAAVAAR